MLPTCRTLLLSIALLPGLLFSQKKTDPAPGKKIQEFDAYISAAQKTWEVPGLAVAVVKDGQTIWSKGYGVRELGKADVVDSQTLFACASTTKAMTAVCMGILVDEGKVNWEDPVVKHLPEFLLYDPYVTRELKIKDLFTHNSGVGNTDFLWGYMDISSDEILERMRQVRPTYSLRSGFIYQNIFYVVAGKVIEKVSGQPWKKYIVEKIFQPLGMTRTVPGINEATDPNRTKPHFNIEGKISVITHTDADAIGPAGSVWSCADDIAKWMQCMLDSSKYNGGRLITPRTWMEMFKPQVMVPASQFYPTMQLTQPTWTTYGLGWFQHDYKGKKVNFHTGSLAGAIAIHGQLPEQKLGIFVLGNYDHAEVRHALMYKAFDLFALGGTRDWSTEFFNLYDKLRKQGEKKEADFENSRVLNTQPALTLDSYAGRYFDPLYGEVVISLAGKQLSVNINNSVRATLDHWHFETFRGWFEKKWNGQLVATFSANAEGKITTVTIDGMDFKRK